MDDIAQVVATLLCHQHGSSTRMPPGSCGRSFEGGACLWFVQFVTVVAQLSLEGVR